MKTSILLTLSLLFSILIQAQVNPIKPPSLGEQFPNFILPVYQGGEFNLEQMRGKIVLLIASRGKYAEDHWCAICNYQYAEWAYLATNENIRENLNLEIVFLMPYSKDSLTEWNKTFAVDMQKIEQWKFPPDTNNLTTDQKNWVEYTRKKFPRTFIYPDLKVQLPLPVLMDDQQILSKGLDIFRTEWNGGKAPQNIPSVYIIDKEGIVQFKYISQNTFDRPSAEYIIDFIRKMMPPKKIF